MDYGIATPGLSLGASASNLTSGTVPLNLLPQVAKSFTGVGLIAAGGITTTGTKVGDLVTKVTGYVTSTGVELGLQNSKFEGVVSVVNQIRQTSTTDLSANTYVFETQPQS